MHSLVKSFLIAILLLISIPAWAGRDSSAADNYCASQKDPQLCAQIYNNVENGTTSSSSSSKLKDVLASKQSQFNSKQILSITQNFMIAGNTMAQRFIPYAYGLTSVLGAIAFVWLGIMIMLSQADIWHMGLRPLFTLIFTVGFAFMLLEMYSSITESVVDGFLFAGNILIGGSGNGSAISTVINTFQSNFFHMIHFMTKVLNEGTISGPWWDVLIDVFEELFNLVIDTTAITITIAISGILFLLFIVLFLSYQIVSAIAIAVGPVFIPFLVLPVTRSLFDGWVKMLIMSGIYLMTSMVIVGLVGTALDSFFAEMGSPTQGGVFLNYVVYLELMILEIVSVLALLKTHEFAHAIGGSVNISGMNPGNMMVSLAKGGK